MAVSVTLLTPVGEVVIDIADADLADPEPPQNAGFRPPTIFAAPLPVGSGARALGQAGAFTAVADDATAASWNPAGLVQLESPEISAVYRFSAREDLHDSRTDHLATGEDRYFSRELNYLSGVYPFIIGERNAVFSFNYQEAYDFTMEFSALFNGNNQQSLSSVTNATVTDVDERPFGDPFQTGTLVQAVSTDISTEIDQLLTSALLSGIDFRQSGTIDAFSPSFAMDVSPRFSLGVSVNIYTDGASRGNPIRSSMTADYAGTSDSFATITDTYDTTVDLNWSGVYYDGPPFDPRTNSFTGSESYAFTTVETNVQTDAYSVEGRYRELNSTEDFYGVNATLGALWTASEKLTVGAALDLPWTGYGRQTKRIDHRVSTFDSNLVEVASSTFSETQKRDVEYTFPLYWSVGALLRWTDRFYTSMDISQTCWSQFSYQAEGEARINPVNGEPHASSALDDCWSVRLGGEYLCVFSQTEIPLRGGLFWEQRPADGQPDEYWGFSLGSGISLGQAMGKTVLDIAYIFEQGNDVMGSLLPEKAVYSDTYKHQLFVSAIRHF
ncbi:MAG: outer membrane protein transport protein [Pontiellaceae bacterium]|nr:outer membrane protein transport protein [Pontiellaceae bacterium]